MAREPGTTTAFCGNDQGLVHGCAQNCAVDEVEYRCASSEDGSGCENCALTDDRPFVDSAIATDEHFVFDDDGAGVDGLKDAADLCCGAEVDALTDLGAGSDEGVRIDHRSLIYPRAGVDVHGGHADCTLPNVSAGAHRRAAGNDANSIGRGEMAWG